MASGSFDFGESLCRGYVEWSSEWSYGNTHTLYFTFYGERTDWSGSTQFWSSISLDGSYLESPSAHISGYGEITNQKITVQSDDAGKMTSSLSLGCGFTSSGTGKKYEAWGTLSGVQLDKPPKTFTIVKPTGTSLTVSRNSGSTVYYGDIFTVTAGSVTGYTKTTFTVSGASLVSGNTYSVTGNVTITASSSLQSFTLSINAGTGSSITVKRTSSQQSGASLTTLSNGAIIYYFDQLQISFGSSTGYNLDTHTVNSANFTSGDTYSVTGAVSVISTATVQSWELLIQEGAGSTITVTRTSSPKQGAETGQLSNGSIIYYSDVLQIVFTALPGNEILTQTVNGDSFVSGNSHTVIGAVTVITSTKMLGLVYIGDGQKYDAYFVYIYNGSSWDMYAPYIYNGTSWDLYT